MLTIKTMGQDWKDGFLFLTVTEGLQTPFLFILLHARSVKHLDQMLHKWLLPHWRLSNDERTLMIAHWKKWYQPYRAQGGTSDHLVRSAVTEVCQEHDTFLSCRGKHKGLRSHYSERLVSSQRKKEIPQRPAFSRIYRSKRWNWHRLFDTESRRFKRLDCSLAGAGGIALVFAAVSAEKEQAWWIMVGVEVQNLTEELTHTLLGLPGVVAVECSDQYAFLHFDLDETRLATLATIDQADHQGFDEPTDVIIPKVGLVSEIQRQLTQMGVPVVISDSNGFDD